ncbi:MAG TPA: hypothetical protein ENJ02_05590 [Chloroflexi bacterium]|nr:hypothetical protein [Chloroflexota bacterium]
MSDKKAVDFTTLVEQVTKSQVGKEALSIWGGRCAESDLVKFLEQWNNLAQMPYRIWEYASKIVFEKDTLPDKAVLLQRGRLFGADGDLEVRRDGEKFAWRFVGPAGTQPPDGDYQTDNYWDAHPDVVFFEEEASALLWGQRQMNNGRWKENRVGAAHLAYPADPGWQRVQVHYKTFSRAGRPQFVWYTSLSEWKEDDNA